MVFKKGSIPWNKGEKSPQISKAKLGHKVSVKTREKISKSLSKSNHPNWKGGLMKRRGYIYAYMKGHLKAESHGYIKRSKLVWYLHTGEWVEIPYCIHHKNGIKTDDRFENLKKMLFGKHSRLHNTKKNS